MPQSLSFLLIHLIFSTKNRMPVFDETIRQSLHGYIAGVGRQSDCEVFRVGGPQDHVHIAIRIPRTVTIAELVEQLKISSSKWIKYQSERMAYFAWQRGYAAFSVSPGDLEVLVRYIENQQEHHRRHTFQEEYRAFLVKYGLDFDERYIWDWTNHTGMTTICYGPTAFDLCGGMHTWGCATLRLPQALMLPGRWPSSKQMGVI
jgi:REP element-mobilizing transposase RayT